MIIKGVTLAILYGLEPIKAGLLESTEHHEAVLGLSCQSIGKRCKRSSQGHVGNCRSRLALAYSSLEVDDRLAGLLRQSALAVSYA